MENKRQKWVATKTGKVIVGLPWWAPTPPAFPPRYANQVTPLVDGRKYMSEVANAMLAAETRIWITAWDLWLDIRLKRGTSELTLRRLLLEKKGKLQSIDIRVILSNAWMPDGQNVFGPTSLVSTVQEELTKMGIQAIRSTPGEEQDTSQHQKTIVIDNDIAFLGGIDLAMDRWDYDPHTLTTYKNAGLYDADNVLLRGLGIQDRFNPFSSTDNRPRLPWHDSSIKVKGPAARDVATNFFQRWNAERLTGKVLADLDDAVDPATWPEPVESSGRYTVQVVRTVRVAGDGDKRPAHDEATIHDVYCQAILNARYYIYIEQQYFISDVTLAFADQSAEPKTYVKNKVFQNQVAICLVQRIFDAIQSDTPFKVILVLPILGGTGDFLSEAATGVLTRNTLRFITEVVADKLVAIGKKAEQISDYFLPVTLRVASLEPVDGKVVSEQVYVHSKMMIADDLFVTIGSANVNDRGLLPGKDSELNAVIIDSKTELLALGGASRYTRPFARDLRLQLWDEHFGPGLPEDPFPAYDEIAARLKKRTEAFKTAGLIANKNTASIEHLAKLKEVSGLGNAISYPVDLDQAREIEMLRGKSDSLLDEFSAKDPTANPTQATT